MRHAAPAAAAITIIVFADASVHAGPTAPAPAAPAPVAAAATVASFTAATVATAASASVAAATATGYVISRLSENKQNIKSNQ